MFNPVKKRNWAMYFTHTVIIPNLYAIGDTGPAGGIVFYITDGGLHGLEAAPSDQADAEWGCNALSIPGALSTAIGTGVTNTAAIVAGCADVGIAAKLANDYSLNGFDDWFLPSYLELKELSDQRTVVGGIALTSDYWSSTEAEFFIAFCVDMEDGQPFDCGKDISLPSRAIRGF
jgi:hypothetical protein